MDSLRAAQIHNALATLCKKMDKELLYKYINGQTSEQEEKTIVDWLDADPNNQKELNALWSMQDALIANVPYPHHPHLQLPTRRLKWYRQRFIRICTQAAAVLLLVAGSWYASRTVIIEDTAKQYLSVAAPAGQRIDITLQDGTSVCLNSGAKLEYPIRFNRNRRVKLSGEAMFNVEHDAARPFIVETFACDVEVLGTKFNLKSYAEDSEVEVTLVEGSVEMETKLGGDDRIVRLRPGELVKLDKRTGSTETFDVPTDTYRPVVCGGGLFFMDKRFDEIVAYLEKRFDVKINVADRALAERRFIASFVNGESLDEMLASFNADEAMRIRREGRIVNITKR